MKPKNNVELNPEYTLLAIDPSVKQTGYAILRVDENGSGNWKGKNVSIIEKGIIPTQNLTHGQSLMYFERKINEILLNHKIDHVTSEQMFAGNNRKTAMQLSHIHGVMQLQMAKNNLDIVYYSVMTAKSVVSGGMKTKHEDGTKKTGDEMKMEIAGIVDDIFNGIFPNKQYQLDITDAISIGLTFISMGGKIKVKPPKKRKKVVVKGEN